MDEAKRKEEPSLPPDYVSLAQLQERWLQKQEEKKLKQKQEEEETRERDAQRKLKQKQEEEEKREREARAAQNEKNQNQNQNRRGMRTDGRARMAGGFVREKGVIQGKGKGKEIIHGGARIGGENDKERENKGRTKKRKFKRATAVEPKEKAGVDAEELSGGDTVRAGISNGGVGGIGGGLNVVEEIGKVSGEVLPKNGVKEEIEDVKRTTMGGGLRGIDRNRGSGCVDQLKQSEMALNLEKKMEGEKGYGKKWRGGGRNYVEEKGNVSVEGSLRNGVKEEMNVSVEVSLRNGVKEEITDVKSTDLRGGLRGNGINWGSGGVNELKQSEIALNLEKKMKGEKGYGKKWGGGGRNGSYPERLNRLHEFKHVVLESNKVDPALEKKAGNKVFQVCSEISSLSVEDRDGIQGQSSSGSNRVEEDRVEGECSNGVKVVEDAKGYGGKLRWVVRDSGGGSNGDNPKRFNRFLEHRPVVLKGNMVDPELEKKAEDELSEVSSVISSLSAGDRNGIWGRSSCGSNKAEEDRVEGEGSNDDKVVLEIEKKMEGEKGYGGRGRGREGGVQRNRNYPKRFNRFQEHRPVVLEGTIMDSELGKKAGDEVSEVSFEISILSVGNRNKIGGRSSNRSNNAQEDRVEGEGSNGDKVVMEIEKKMESEKGFGGRGRGGAGGRGREGGRNGDFPARFNRSQGHRPVVLEGIKVVPELQKKAENAFSEVSSEISSLSIGDRNGIRGQSSNGCNKAEVDRVEAECSNGDKVAQEFEKKDDREVLVGESARKGENRGAGKGNQIYGNQRGDIGQGRRDTRPKISDSHQRGGSGRGRRHTRPEISDSDWRGDFGRGRRHTRPEMSEGRWATDLKVTGMVWVKKEEKLGA